MSKLMVFEFKCPGCDAVFDTLVRPNERHHVCPNCQSPHAERILSAPRLSIRMGVDPVGNPTMGAKWARMHEQARKDDEKRARDNGPGAWGAAGADVRR